MDKYAELIFPPGIENITNNFKGVNRLPRFFQEKICRILPPFTVGNVLHDTDYSITGELIACPVIESDIIHSLQEIARDKIVTGIRHAESKGVALVGLGHYTHLTGDYFFDDYINGYNVELNFGITYSAYIALECAKLLAYRCGMDWEHSNVILVGVDSLVGEACGEILAREVRYLSYFFYNNINASLFTKRIMYEYGLSVGVTNDIDKKLLESDIVFLLTSEWEKHINIEMFKKDSIVIPILCSQKNIKKLQKCRPDLKIAIKGIINTPYKILGDSWLYHSCDNIYDYMVETIILAQEKKQTLSSPGSKKITRAQIDRMRILAKEKGFVLSGICYADGAVSMLKYQEGG